MVTKMGIDTIAEGVEKVDQLLILQQLNCKTIQGFLRGKPMNELFVEKFLLGEIKL
jgi:EAL domain-containing protein (putative c-di-GMP-specific phosphodiesterase class I)